jgi:DNA repair exonuclease SbcCD nuclease subunit
MERRKFNRIPSAILTSDWHIRESTPTCYTEGGDFLLDQWNAIMDISELQKKYDCQVLHPGDLFHSWKPSPWLLSMTMLLLPKQFYTVYGQHDLPQHSLKLKKKSGIYTLETAGKINVLKECNFGEIPNKGSLLFPNRDPDRMVLV